MVGRLVGPSARRLVGQSLGQSVGRSGGPSDCRAVGQLARIQLALLPLPSARLHATNVFMYTALFVFAFHQEPLEPIQA